MMSPWGAAVASGLILGLLVRLPYYSLPFFYGCFEHPLAAGPALARRVPVKQDDGIRMDGTSHFGEGP